MWHDLGLNPGLHRPLVNTLPIRPMSRYLYIQINKSAQFSSIWAIDKTPISCYCYIVIYSIMQKYTYICWIHTDAIIIKTPDDKVGKNKRRTQERKTQEDFFIKNILPLTLFVRFRNGLLKVCVWGGAGDRTLLKYFDTQSYGRSALCLCSFFMAAQPDPGVNSSVYLAFPTTIASTLRLPLYCLPSFLA